jgi:hypothetical protein
MQNVQCFSSCQKQNWEQKRTSDHLDVLQAREDTCRFHGQDRKQAEQRVGPSFVKKPEARAEELEDGHRARHLLEVEVAEGRNRDVKLWKRRRQERGVRSGFTGKSYGCVHDGIEENSDFCCNVSNQSLGSWD